ncbi:hypothetical protein BGZ60DRAFT_67598 [Tricladium varicosporioides]|nr:hypothetical protein BGZ60DRAFT_67598 [Hymenoscyphus varicosporioides]
MPPNFLNEVEDEDAINKSTTIPLCQSLSCPSCPGTNFSSLSKLNKHRNIHRRPYECRAVGCAERFAQRQTLDRHTQTKHNDSSEQTKYYQCTVDSCKYSSTGQRGKSFARLDQVKEHIKEHGHYGPHSANNRGRRPGNPLFQEYLITACFEECISDNGAILRTVNICLFDSLKTKLWHKDDIGEHFVRKNSPGEISDCFECFNKGCYYGAQPIEGYSVTRFKTKGAMMDHARRAHGSPSPFFASEMLVEENGITSSAFGLTYFSNCSLGNLTLDSSIQPDSGLTEDLDCDASETIYLDNAAVPPEHQISESGFRITNLSTGFSKCGLHPYNLSTQDFTPDTFQCLNRQSSDPVLQVCPESPSTTLSSLSSSFETSFWSSCKRDVLGSTSSTSSFLSRQDSHTKRLPCIEPGCSKTFLRKYDLQRHVHTVHRPTSGFICPYCKRPFGRKDKLYEHLRRIHSIDPKLTSKEQKRKVNELSKFSSSDWSTPAVFQMDRDIAPSDMLKKKQ